ncbi:MAG: cell envelope integrity protein CreD [Candidatus Pacebacteria bacterium]|nr:cell envelope integrity protein CreD [Candidatus Paceibacterota bacterium]
MKNYDMNHWIRYSVTLRVVVIGILALLLLIPVGMVGSLIREREYNREGAIAEISQKWGEVQTVAGPVLSIPYDRFVTNEKGVQVTVTEYMHFLPETLDIEGNVSPEIRSRGIFDAVVYSSEMEFSGVFKKPDVGALGINPQNVHWNDAFVSVGIPDMRGIKSEVAFIWNDKTYDFGPGIETDDVIRAGLVPTSINDARRINEPFIEKMVMSVDMENESSGISTMVPVGRFDVGEYAFSLTLALDGSQSLLFVPLGRTTNVNLASVWDTPSFNGAFLPDTREVTDDGFSASWEILDLNRNYPQLWVGSKHNIYSATFGVNLLVPVDEYQKSERSAKYAMLIISLTFMIFFFSEIFNKKRVHPIQYLLVGLALVLYYSLLISFSEVVGFDWAYLIASVSTIGLISGYSKVILPTSRMLYLQALILAFLYLFVYTILQLEDYALLAGSIGLFIILSVVMYLSRKIDWYKVGE